MAGKGQKIFKRPPNRRQPRPALVKKPGEPNTHWGGVAEWYDKLVGDDGSEYQREVVLPGVMRLLGLGQNERVIDVACGQGVLCRLLSERGAGVVGVDAARELIDAARTRGPATIDYLLGDARELHFLPAGTFTAAACVLAIQNIHPIQPVFTGVARLLRPGGRFVLVMMHPAFRGPKETSWQWDPKTGEQYRRVDRYMIPRKTPIVTHPGKDPDTYTWSFHKPLEQFVRTLRNAGMLIDALEEWTSHKVSEPGPRAAAENQARKEIPMFLALRAFKLRTAATERSAEGSAADVAADSDTPDSEIAE